MKIHLCKAKQDPFSLPITNQVYDQGPLANSHTSVLLMYHTTKCGLQGTKAFHIEGIKSLHEL